MLIARRCVLSSRGGRSGRLAVGELPLRKNDRPCQKPKSSPENPCPKAIALHRLRQCQFGLRNRGRTGKSGGEERFWILDWRSPSLIFLSGNLSVVYLSFYLLTGLEPDRVRFSRYKAIRFCRPELSTPARKNSSAFAIVSLVLPRGWLGLDRSQASMHVAPGILPRRWLGTESFRLTPQLDERRRAASPARTKELLK